MLTHDMIVALVIFAVAYLLITTEKIPYTLTALAGGFMMVLFGILSQEEAFRAVDLSVIFLLIGMMLLMEVLSETGLFEYLAIKISQLGRGNPVALLLLLSFSTAVLSAFLDNVTTVLLIAPVTIFIADQLDVDAIPFLVSEALASNIGGTATLIGDPPNILIGSSAKLSFSEFLSHLAPVVLLILVFFLLTVWLIFRKKLRVSQDLKAKIMDMEPARAIKNVKAMVAGLSVLAMILAGFFTHSVTHFEPATIAFVGAVILLILTKKHPAQILHKVEWDTLFFFIGLFVLVEGVVKAGLIGLLAQSVLGLTQNSVSITSMVILWVSGLFSTIVNNIPFVATLIPMIKAMIPQLAQAAHAGTPAAVQAISYPLWWALALGACLGGNGTLIGASANMIAASVASKNRRKISFWTFTKYGLIVMIQSLIISSFYIYWRYL